MSLARARTFLLGTYHDLPNVLFIGCLILGAIIGYLPLVWLSLGLIMNGAIVAILQGLLSFIFGPWSQIAVPSNSLACDVFAKMAGPSSRGGVTFVAPSHWLAAAVFFATFNIYNSVQVGMKEPAKGASSDKVNNRRAFSLSTLVIGLVFLGLIFFRGFTGCETWLGSVLGAVVGGSVAVGYWHILDACGTGLIPDVLQVVGAMAPSGSENVPVVCSPPPRE